MSDEPAALFDRAKTLHQAGHLAEAIVLYGRAAELKPDYAEAHNNLGNALGEAKRFEEAIASLQRAAALRPELAPVHSNLGLALARQRRFEEALECHRRALALQPELAAAHNNAAMALKELGRLDEAIDHYRRAIVLRDKFAEAHGGLGMALMALKRYSEAITSLRRAVELGPHLIAAHTSLGNALLELDQPEEAAASFRRVIEIDPTSATAQGNLGHAMRDLERYAEALDCYDRAIGLDPALASVHNNRGIVLLQLGRRVEAQAAFERAIAASPQSVGVYFQRVRAMRGLPSDHDTEQIKAMLGASSQLTPAERSALHFALGTAFEAQGHFDQAFANFQAANRLRRESIEFDEAALREHHQRTQQIFTRRAMDGHEDSGSRSSLPIFIVGMARSGSTMIEQILASHPQVHGAGERSLFENLLAAVRLPDGSPGRFPDCLPALRGADFRLLGEAYVERLRTHHPSAARITDKLLANYLNIGLIRLMLPNARILHAVREPLDSCVSAYCLPFTRNAQASSYDLGELGRHYRLYADLMAHWRRVLPADAMLEVRYEELVADLEGGVRRILDYCGLPWDERCLAFHETDRIVKTASLTQVREKVYSTSVGRWRRYEKHLGPLLEALGPYAPKGA